MNRNIISLYSACKTAMHFVIILRKYILIVEKIKTFNNLHHLVKTILLVQIVARKLLCVFSFWLIICKKVRLLLNKKDQLYKQKEN